MSQTAAGRVYEAGQWEVDLVRRELRLRGVRLPVGGRAFEIIEVLVKSAGNLVGKDDLMASVWPGVVVEENTLQVHISAVRKALGQDRGVVKTVSGRGYRLLGDWKVRQDSASAGLVDRTSDISSSNRPPLSGLPAASSELIGRSAAIRHLQDLMSAYRAVTLTGAGGIGKTALALGVARRLASRFGENIALVELGSLSDPNLVAPTMAHALRLNLSGGANSPQSIARAVGSRNLLLVLDNCEHVIEAAAELAEAIVLSCPNASVLTTSREVLRIDGEYVFRVPPLNVPTIQAADAQAILGYSAVQLFIARMCASQMDFEPRPEQLGAITAICRRLDGIPLAIEFAAARATGLGIAEVASHLDSRFELLTTGRRTAVARQQTLRATLDWSYELLPEPERRLLHHLAIFPADFTLEAVAAVMGASDGKIISHISNGIFSLVSKSLVVFDGSAFAGRWRLLETIRAYALEKLDEAGEADDAARRHAEFYRDCVSAAAPAAALEPTTESLCRCIRELGNVRAALDWAFSSRGNITTGVVMTAEFMPVWLHLSLMGECRERIERALRSLVPELDLGIRLEMQLHIGLAYALIHTGGTTEAVRTELEAALKIAEFLDDIVAQNYALWAMWAFHANRGEYLIAQRVAGRFTRLAHRSQSPARRLVADRLLGATMHYRGSQSRARHYLERLLVHDHKIRDGPHAVWFRYDIRVMAQASLARVLCVQGFLDQARALALTSRESAQAANHLPMLCHTLAEAVGPVALMTGDFATADRAVVMLIDCATNQNAAFWTIVARCLEGACCIQRGDFGAGTVLLHAALDTCRQTGWMNYYPAFMAAFAIGQAHGGQVAEAIVTVDKALLSADHSGERWYTAELLRIKGKLLLKTHTEQSAAAEACLYGGLRLARRQGALFWELRAALDLASLRLRQNAQDDARQILAPVYERFTEGFDAPELCSARAILASLHSH